MISGNTRPHPEKVPYPIIRPRVNLTVRFTVLTREIFGLDTHWGNGATYYCVGPDKCPTCLAGGIARYQGYVMGRGWDTGIVGIIHLTASAAEYVDNISVDCKGLVGLKLWLERAGNLENGEVHAMGMGWEPETEEFSMETFSDLMHAVYRVRKISEKSPHNLD